MTEITKGRVTRVSSQTTSEFSRKLPEIKRVLLIFMHKFYFLLNYQLHSVIIVFFIIITIQDIFFIE